MLLLFPKAKDPTAYLVASYLAVAITLLTNLLMIVGILKTNKVVRFINKLYVCLGVTNLGVAAMLFVGTLFTFENIKWDADTCKLFKQWNVFLISVFSNLLSLILIGIVALQYIVIRRPLQSGSIIHKYFGEFKKQFGWLCGWIIVSCSLATLYMGYDVVIVTAVLFSLSLLLGIVEFSVNIYLMYSLKSYTAFNQQTQTRNQNAIKTLLVITGVNVAFGLPGAVVAYLLLYIFFTLDLHFIRIHLGNLVEANLWLLVLSCIASGIYSVSYIVHDKKILLFFKKSLTCSWKQRPLTKNRLSTMKRSHSIQI